jgi:anti-anti-sigma regulatory factor
MFKITRAKNAAVVLRVSGRMNSENLSELRTLVSAEAREQRVVLDLSELILVDQDAVRFLERCEMNGVELRNCPAYVREWITRERQGN